MVCCVNYFLYKHTTIDYIYHWRQHILQAPHPQTHKNIWSQYISLSLQGPSTHRETSTLKLLSLGCMHSDLCQVMSIIMLLAKLGRWGYTYMEVFTLDLLFYIHLSAHLLLAKHRGVQIGKENVARWEVSPNQRVYWTEVLLQWIWFYWMFYDNFFARSLLAKLGRWGWWFYCSGNNFDNTEIYMDRSMYQ